MTNNDWVSAHKTLTVRHVIFSIGTEKCFPCLANWFFGHSLNQYSTIFIPEIIIRQSNRDCKLKYIILSQFSTGSNIVYKIYYIEQNIR